MHGQGMHQMDQTTRTHRIGSHRGNIALRVMSYVALLLLAPLVSATPILELNGSGGDVRNNFSGTVGSRFIVGMDDITVNALGFEDSDGNGLASQHMVGLWRVSDRELLASALIGPGTQDPLIDAWRYAAIGGEVLLEAGAEYAVGAAVSAGDGDAFTDTEPSDYFTMGPGIASFSAAWSTQEFGWPGTLSMGRAAVYAPANATFIQAFAAASVPTPASMALVVCGLIGFALRRRVTA